MLLSSLDLLGTSSCRSSDTMAENKETENYQDELLDYEEEEEVAGDAAAAKGTVEAQKK